MSKAITLALKAGERIYINGAVVRSERRTTLQILNEAVFLLENHVLQPEQATTPLRQLYFVAQMMLMDPMSGTEHMALFDVSLALTVRLFDDPVILDGLAEVERLIASDRPFDALKIIRSLYAAEEIALAALSAPPAALAG